MGSSPIFRSLKQKVHLNRDGPFCFKSEAFLEPRVQSTLRFGRRRTEVPRTSCAPSSAKGPENPESNLRSASVGKELSYLFQEVNRDCRSALFFAFYVKY